MELIARLGGITGIMAGLGLALAGCATPVPRYPSNADLLVVASKAVCTEIVLNNGRVSIVKETRIALADLNAVVPSSGNNPLNALVRDAFVEELSSRATVMEREAPIFNRVARESMYNLSGTVMFDSKAGSTGVQEDSEDMSRTTALGRFLLPTADYLLTYRVLDMGLQYKPLKGKFVKRDAQIYVYYELIDAKNGQVARAERIRMSATDSIESRAKPDVEKSSLIIYDFPMPTTRGKDGAPAPAKHNDVEETIIRRTLGGK